ncbi:hypothetical protein, partial [Bradyrhizobium sp. sBnM-33]|uniref:hypothetical protein n=1 Tax=Bradyrhizobium sp. sBnM-33 TaxID=2831780 RepID=UPI001BCDA56A
MWLAVVSAFMTLRSCGAAAPQSPGAEIVPASRANAGATSRGEAVQHGQGYSDRWAAEQSAAVQALPGCRREALVFRLFNLKYLGCRSGPQFKFTSSAINL